MKRAILIGLCILTIMLVGCSSSFDDCMYNCKYKVHDDMCTDFTDIWDGCTTDEAQARNEVCFDACSG